MIYSRQERETSIVWDDDEKLAHIYTASPVSMRKLDKLVREFPEEYVRTCTETDEEGRITAAKYTVPCRRIKFHRPRTTTETQRENLKSRILPDHTAE